MSSKVGERNWWSNGMVGFRQFSTVDSRSSVLVGYDGGPGRPRQSLTPSPRHPNPPLRFPKPLSFPRDNSGKLGPRHLSRTRNRGLTPSLRHPDTSSRNWSNSKQSKKVPIPLPIGGMIRLRGSYPRPWFTHSQYGPRGKGKNKNKGPTS